MGLQRVHLGLLGTNRSRRDDKLLARALVVTLTTATPAQPLSARREARLPRARLLLRPLNSAALTLRRGLLRLGSHPPQIGNRHHRAHNLAGHLDQNTLVPSRPRHIDDLEAVVPLELPDGAVVCRARLPDADPVTGQHFLHVTAQHLLASRLRL